MSFMPYLPLPAEKGRGVRRTATLVGPGMAKAIHSTLRDDTDLSRQRSTSLLKGLAPPSVNLTGSLQDLSRMHNSAKAGGFISGRSSPRLGRASKQGLEPPDYLDDDESQNLIRMNINHLLHQRESEYVSWAEFTVFCGTYNVSDEEPDGNITPWFASQAAIGVPDIIAVAFQELDNSNQAYLFAESARQPQWINAVGSAILDAYPNHFFEHLQTERLVGIMLVIFVQKIVRSAIHSVDTSFVGCGLLGRLGNKGGAAIRLNIHDTSICFVSSHLSAHLEESERRNQDFREINARAVFTKVAAAENNEPLRIDNHDIVFWMGDLNYRIVNLPNEKCKAAIEQGLFDSLYADHDQLHEQMTRGLVFNGYNEGEIKFRPTYKYDTGTDRWDSSEKARIPAWCDRILWKVNADDAKPVKQLVYRSHPGVFVSDHKPVSSIFTISARIVDDTKYNAVYRQILRDFDKNENQQRPQAEPDQREIDLGEVKFLETNNVHVCIKNTGTVPLEFVFKPTPNHPQSPSPRWLTVMPNRGKIPNGQSATIQFSARINPDAVSEIALTQKREFSDVLVLHLVCGGDSFIPVRGRLALTCFGLPLSVLNSVANPIGMLDPSELVQIMGTPPSELQKSFPLPKEVFRLVDRLSQPDALKHKELFRVQGTLHEEILVRDALDRTFPGEPIPGSLPSVGEALLDFLRSLPTPLVPVALQEVCMQVSTSTELSSAFLDNSFQKNSPKHHALFLYLLKFLGEFVRHRRDNLIDIPYLANLFAELTFRHLSPSATGESRLPQQAMNFVLRLLAKEAGVSWEEICTMQSFGGESDA